MPIKVKKNFKSKVPLADCANCPLLESTFVPVDDLEIKTEEGYSSCDFAWLGMHPGQEEAKAGKVFIGPAGKLLRSVNIKIFELLRESLGKMFPKKPKSVYLNSVLCAPSVKENFPYLSEKAAEEAAANINESARQHCYKGVWKLLERYKPKLIIAMGPEGLQTADVYEGSILDKHGTVKRVDREYIESSPNKNKKRFVQPVLSSVHPAYVIRPTGTRFYQEYVDGIYYGIRNFYKPIKLPTYEIINTVAGLAELYNKLPEGASVGLDSETAGLKLYDEITCFQISCKALDDAVTTGNENSNENKERTSYIIEWPADLTTKYDIKKLKWELFHKNNKSKTYYKAIKKFLESPKFKFILQHANFDKAQFLSFGININVDFDTLFESHLVNENCASHSLKYQGRLRLGWPDWDKPITDYVYRQGSNKAERAAFRWTNIPRKSLLYPYAALDPVGTDELHEILYNQEMDPDSKWCYETFPIPAVNMFAEIRTRGIRIDIDKTLKLVKETKKEVQELYETRILPVTEKFGLDQFNPNSSKDTLELLFDHLKLNLPIERGKPIRSTNKKYFEQLPQLDVIQAVKEYRELTHDVDSYYLGIAKLVYADLCIHPDFDLTLKTGRLATSNPSILNIKKDSRVGEMFIPYYPNDYWILKIDQAQFELRVFAAIANAVRMLEAFNQDIDVHGYFGLLMDPNYAAAVAANPELRTRIKNVVFGTLFNAGDYQNAISARESALKALRASDPARYEAITASTTQGQQLYEAWFDELVIDMKRVREAFNELCPEATDFKETIEAEIYDKGFIQTVTGRRRHCPLVPREQGAFKHLLNQMINSPVQGPASELNVAAAVDVHNHYRDSMDAFVDTTNHDALIVEADKNRWEEVLTTTCEYMVTAPARYLGEKHPIFKEVPFKVEAEIGPNWKNMSKVEMINGKWVVEDPKKIGMKV